MRRPVCYDVTRLLTRILNATPNGIDRVDLALAQHYLAADAASEPTTTFGSVCLGIASRLLTGAAASEAVDGIAAHWGETDLEADADPVYHRVVRWLTARDVGETPRPTRRRRTLPAAAIPRWIARHGVPIARTPLAHLPHGSVYLNVSQFPLWMASPFEWLERRRDVSAVFFVHDLLPIIVPEYFRKAEYARHQKRLRNVARFASAAIVTTRTVASDLDAHLTGIGRRDLPVFVAPTPISPIFATPRFIEPALVDHPFFVLCSTLEPRKNHLMILAMWRALAGKMGRDTPKLVLVGTRGWHYGPIVDLLERSPALRDHVLEVGGLSTPGLKRLIDNARAVLMPSFGEGYGLPVHEALLAGAPVIAADIPAFGEIEAEGLTLLSPLDGDAWLAAIETHTRITRAPTPPGRLVNPPWASYFERLDGFIARL